MINHRHVHVHTWAPKINRRCPRCSTAVIRRPGPIPRVEETWCPTCREHVEWRGTPPGVQAALEHRPVGRDARLRDTPIRDTAQMVRDCEMAADVLDHWRQVYGDNVESEAVEEWGWQS